MLALGRVWVEFRQGWGYVYGLEYGIGWGEGIFGKMGFLSRTHT